MIIVGDPSREFYSPQRISDVSNWPGDRKVLAHSLVRTSRVGLFALLFENTAQMVFIQDQEKVRTFFTNGAHLPFCESIRLESVKWGADNFDPCRRKPGTERGTEFRIAIMEKKSHRLRIILQIADQLASLLDNPGWATCEMDSSGSLCDEEESGEGLHRGEIPAQKRIFIFVTPGNTHARH